MEGTPSDVVELILAVDLNPKDPEEPINVNSVDVHPKGEGESGEKCHMCTRILDAISKIDPKMEAAVDGKPVEEAIAALEEMANEAPEEAQEEASPFDKAMSMSHGSMDMPMHRPAGSFRGASDRAFGRRRDEDEEE